MQIRNGWAGALVEYYEEIDSTNRAAKDSDLPHGTLFIAKTQTMGRGRAGRSWQSGPGLGIYSTLLLRPEGLSARDTPRVTHLTAVSVAEGLASFGIDAHIKWPNDIVADGKKICGILCESNLSGMAAEKVVMGAGINYLHEAEDFDGSFREHATSVRMLLDEVPPRERILEAYMERVEANYEAALTGALLGSYRELCVTLGRPVRVFGADAEFLGMAVDLREDGALIVRTQDGGDRVVVAGDVSVRGVMGYV